MEVEPSKWVNGEECMCIHIKSVQLCGFWYVLRLIFGQCVNKPKSSQTDVNTEFLWKETFSHIIEMYPVVFELFHADNQK